MGVVDVELELILSLQLRQATQLHDPPGHREHSIAHHQCVRPIRLAGELPREILHVVKQTDLSACESGPVDEAGVILSLREDHRTRDRSEGGDDADVSEKTRGKYQRLLVTKKLRELTLERVVEVEVAVQEARPGAPSTIVIDGLLRCRLYLRMVGESQ